MLDEKQRNAGDAHHVESSFDDDDDDAAIVPCRLEVGEFSFLSLTLYVLPLFIGTNNLPSNYR